MLHNLFEKVISRFTMSLSPTYFGLVNTPEDAIKIAQATVEGFLQPIYERLNDHEKKMIQPGNVFVFIEGNSNIKRW